MTGVMVDRAGGIEVLLGEERVGARRLLGAADVELLDGLTARYGRVLLAGADAGAFIALGRELFAWLDGDGGQLGDMLARAGSPLVFEVTSADRSPSDVGWALLRAPWELLCRPSEGFLAEDELTRFCVVRRLGQPELRTALDGMRLGLAFMSSAPRGQRELDFEAEEAAILAAVGDTRMDLLVEDTGDPEQLGQRLADTGGMPVVHVSCHGHNSIQLRALGRECRC